MSELPIAHIGQEEFLGQAAIHRITSEAGLLGVSSDSGGVQVITLATKTAVAPANQACRSFLIWTPSSQVYLNIGATADAADVLIPADVILPMPFNNTSLARLFNDAGGNATIYVVWRS
jgi:hypothetical protein